MKNPMNDKDFLKQLDLVKNKETYIKIYNLNFDEQPREEIEGKVISGSINIDGTSAVRRTCSLSIVADEININNYLWSLNTKIKIKIGLKNNINNNYDNIIWFNQGTFILTSFSVSYSSNSYTINLSGQDKMCLLNGSVGGALPASIDFKQEVINSTVYEEVDLGPKFIPELYQVADKVEKTIDTNEYITQDRIYYEKVYDQYQIVNLDVNSYQPGKYYIENPNIFIPATKPLEYYLTNQINLYDYNTEMQDYTLLDMTNTNEIDLTKQYYVSNEYILLNKEAGFNSGTEYFCYNKETNKFQTIKLNENSFNQFSMDLYIRNDYILSTRAFNNELEYYELIKGSYNKVYLNSITYKANTYYYDIIISFKPCEQVFNPNEVYYDFNKEQVDFYQKINDLSLDLNYAYTSGRYYIKNIYEDDFIPYEGEYNPTLTYYDKKVYSDKKDIPIKTIIKEAVHTYGREPYHNIIINDVDDQGLVLMEYRGKEPLYLLVNNGICENIVNEEQTCYIIPNEIDNKTIDLYTNLIEEEFILLDKKLNENKINRSEYKELRKSLIQVLLNALKAVETTISNEDLIVYNTFIEGFDKNPSQIFFITDNSNKINIYTILKLTYGDAAGYRVSDLVYPSDLISQAGESLTSILDKIINVFPDFEYFYDVDGRFIFQKKKTYLNTHWNNIITQDNETYATSAADTSAVQYTFEDNDLIISVSNNIKLDNLKNDYSVWGVRKNIGEAEVPIHARYAIDKKPYAYVTFPQSKYNYINQTDTLMLKDINGLKYLTQTIYVNNEYAEDILNLDYDEDIANWSLDKVRIEPTLYQGNMYAGIYYTYIICDWREIIYQMAIDYYKHNQENDFLANLAKYNSFNTDIDYYEGNQFMQTIINNAGKLYPSGVTGYEQYYDDMQGFWRELYNPKPEVDLGYTGGYYVNKKWQDVVADYTKFNCDYYLPLKDYNQYATLLDNSIEEYKNKIAKLEKEKEDNSTDQNFIDLATELEDLRQLLEAAKNKKTNLLKSYYTQKMIAFNDPEYKRLQDQYSTLQKEKEDVINKTEKEILTILKEQFELY